MTFAENRLRAGLSVDDVCRDFGVGLALARAWEEGAVRPPEHVMRSLEVIGRYTSVGEMQARSLVPAAAAETDDQAKAKASAASDQPSVIQNAAPVSPSSLIKSKKRVSDHGEVFTPPWLVEKMLDLVKGEAERIDSRFLEPACGSGNFLVPILERKLAAVELKYGKSDFEKRHFALYALTSLYGIELLADNIAECRANMLEVFAGYLGLTKADDLYRAASEVLSLNLIHGDAMTMKSADGEPIQVVEWGYLGRGKFQRRDFRLDVLTGMASLREERSLFAGLANHEIFRPVRSYPPMTVRDLAEATDGEAASA